MSSNLNHSVQSDSSNNLSNEDVGYTQTTSVGLGVEYNSLLDSSEILLASTSTNPTISLTNAESTYSDSSVVSNTHAASDFTPSNSNTQPRLRAARQPLTNLVIPTSHTHRHAIPEHEELDITSRLSDSIERKSSLSSPTSIFLDPFTPQRSNSIESRGSPLNWEGYPSPQRSVSIISTQQSYHSSWDTQPAETSNTAFVLSSGVGLGNPASENRRQRTARQSLANLVISASSRVVGSHSTDNSDSQASDGSNPNSPIEPPVSENIPSLPSETSHRQAKESYHQSSLLQPSVASPFSTERCIRLEGNSLCIFGPTNRLRQVLSRILIYRWTEPFVCFLILLNWLILACSSRKESNRFIFGDNWEDYAQLIIYSLFTLEVAARIIVYGFLVDPKTPHRDFSSASSTVVIHPEKVSRVFNSREDERKCTQLSLGKANQAQPSVPRAFLRHSYNRLDFIVVISYWIDFVLTLSGDGRFTLFKGLCALRPIRLLMLTGGLSVIQNSLKMSFPILVTVAMFICYFFVLFGIIGVHAFKGSLSRRCIAVNENGIELPALPERTCGGWYNGTTVMAVTNGPSGMPKGYICPNGQICINRENPEYGLVNFDNIFYSTLNVFVVIATEGWTDIMYYAMDSEYGVITAIYFCALIFIITFFIIQLFIASIVDTFAKIRANSKNRSAFTLNKPTKILKDTADGWTFEDDKQFPSHKNAVWIFLHRMVYNQIFPYCGALAVTIDLIAMSLRNENSSANQIIALDHIEVIFTVLFAVEIILRLLAATSLRQFCHQINNRVDLFLAIATCVVITPYIRSKGIYRYLTVFQVMRSYRVVLCVPRVNQLVRKVFGSVMGIWNLLLYTALFILFSASIAEQLFSGSFNFPDEQDDPYLSFDTIAEGFIALFQILTGENWTTILWNTMRSQNGFMIFIGAVFCVIFYFYSHFIIINLFVAVFLENFEMEEEEKRLQQVQNYVHQSEGKSTFFRLPLFWRKLNPYRYLKPSPELIKVQDFPSNLVLRVRMSYFKQFLLDSCADQSERKSSTKSTVKQPSWLKFFSCWWKPIEDPDTTQMSSYQGVVSEIDLSSNSTFDQTFTRTQMIERQYTTLTQDSTQVRTKHNLHLRTQHKDQFSTSYSELNHESDEESEFQENHPMYNRVLFLFPPESHLRGFCHQILGNRKGCSRSYFDWFILICIFGSVITVAIDSPMRRKYNHDLPVEEQSHVFHYLDYTFVSIFTLEFLLRVLADGLLFTPNAYLLDGWNRLDFVVLILYYVSIVRRIAEFSLLSRAIRASRALRPLRVIRQFKGMKDIMVAMLRGLPKIIDATVLFLLFIIPFAIYGVTLFSGYFYRCNDKEVSGFFDCSGEYWRSFDEDGTHGILIPRVWENPYTHNFDNFWSAMLTLFSMASGEGWVDVLFNGMSIPLDPESQPKYIPYSRSWYNWIYFVIYMLFGSVFAIQLFIGITVDIFKNRSGISLLTVEQRQWVDLQLQLKIVKPSKLPIRSKASFAAWCFDIVHEKHNLFSKAVTGVMVLNVIVMMSEAWDQPHWADTSRNVAYGVFSLIYIFEIIVKLCGNGFYRWYKSRWNIYDAIVTVGVAVTVILRIFEFDMNFLLQIQKFFLVGIAIRVFHKIESLETLLQALVSSLPSILTITGLYGLVLVIYSILFQEIFGLTKYGEDTTPNSNFRSFGNSILMAIRMTTGENWHITMFDMMVEPPYCVHSNRIYLDSDCGSVIWSIFLFISFYVICTYIFLNMFIVVVVGSFTYIYNSNSALALISKDDLVHWKRAWAEFDPRATGYIAPENLVPFFNKLTGKFETRIYDPEHSLKQLRDILTEPDTNPRPYNARPNQFPQYNIRALNQRLSTLNVDMTRARRYQFNQLYQEAMLIRERRGIPFTALLKIFSYRLVNVEQYLGVAELLERKEITHSVLSVWAIEKVRGILRTIVQRRKFIQTESNTPSNMPDSSRIPRIIIDEVVALTDTEDYSPVSSGGSSPISPVSPYVSHQPSFSSSIGHREHQSFGETPSVDTVDYDALNLSFSPNQANTILMSMSTNRWFGQTETNSEDELLDNEN